MSKLAGAGVGVGAGCVDGGTPLDKTCGLMFELGKPGRRFPLAKSANVNAEIPREFGDQIKSLSDVPWMEAAVPTCASEASPSSCVDTYPELPVTPVIVPRTSK